MSQKNVEILIGKLASDEEFRCRFHADPLGTIRGFEALGFELTALEVDALESLDRAALDELAGALDPRLQKASLHTGEPASPDDASAQGGEP